MSDPTDLVNFLFNFQALQVIKLRLVTLEGAVHVVVTAEHRRRGHRWLSLQMDKIKLNPPFQTLVDGKGVR